MRDILFVLWGGAIASAWWGVGIFGFSSGDGVLAFAACIISVGLAVYIILKGVSEQGR